LAIVLGDGVITTGPSGEDPRELFGDPAIGDGLSWSAAGDLLAFTVAGVESTASGPYGSGWPVVAVARLDSSGGRTFPRAFLNGGDPVMAPDGASVVFQRVKLVKILPGRESYLFKSAIWRLDLKTGSVRRLTRWRLAASLNPSSFSPDGSTLVAELYDRLGSRAVAVDLHSRSLSPLARDALEPAYSTDGGRLAFVRLRVQYNDLPEPNRPVSELLVARADGGGAKRLLRRRGFISEPSWDQSGSRLSFTYDTPDFTGSLEPEPGNRVMAINADGTCLTKVFSEPELTLYGAAWEPGPGREAGPIPCASG
jgi:Tol biopolymer transport system component